MAVSANASHLSIVSALSAHQFEKEVDAQFRRYADNLKAPQKYHNTGIELCEAVRGKLESETKNAAFSIESTHYGGSMAKRTDLENSDFDIVMKINDRYPPFSEVLQFFKRIITEFHSELQIRKKSIKINERSLQFAFTNKMEVDLLPASCNLTTGEILQKMVHDPINRRYYSSSLVEKQVKFMKEQSAFAHALARVAKNWYKNMQCPTQVNGGSSIFELLGVAAALDQESMEIESMSMGFSRVVEMLEKLDDMKIGFERSKSSQGSWKLESKTRIEFRPPYLLEPANSTNNFMDGITAEERTLFVRNGEIMKNRIHNLMERRQYCKKGRKNDQSGFRINFAKIFKTVK